MSGSYEVEWRGGEAAPHGQTNVQTGERGNYTQDDKRRGSGRFRLRAWATSGTKNAHV